MTNDVSLIGDLLDTIATYPASVSARVVLMHQYSQLGWYHDAQGVADEILRMEPRNEEAKKIKKTATLVSNKVDSQISTYRNQQNRPNASARPSKRKNIIVHAPQSETERSRLEERYAHGVKNIQQVATELHEDVLAVSQLDGETGSWKERIAGIQALAEGRFHAVVEGGAPCSVRELARIIESLPAEAVNIAADDFVNIVTWLARREIQTSIAFVTAWLDASVHLLLLCKKICSGSLKWHWYMLNMKV